MSYERFTEGQWQAHMQSAGARVWAYVPNVGAVVIATFNSSHVLRDEEKKANAKRVAACVNFCSGVTTAQIESMMKNGGKITDLMKLAKVEVSP